MNSPITPQWWQSLRDDERVRELGIAWRAPDTWAPAGDTATVSGTMRNDLTMSVDARIRQDKLLVGTGPTVSMRGLGVDVDTHWHLDPSDPDRLWCALGDFYDPRLWIPVEPAAEALAEVLSASHPKPAYGRVHLPAFVRGYLGFRPDVTVPNVFDGNLVPLNGPDLDRYATMMSYLEHCSWASSHPDDPMKDDFEAVPPLALAAFDRENRTKAQLLGRLPSMTWRTLHSRSYLTFEIHDRDMMCAAVRYQPSPQSHHAVVKDHNERFGTGYPVDMPLDVVGALTCFDFLTEDALAHHLNKPVSTTHLATAIRIYAALWHGDLRKSLRLREFAHHPEREIRETVVQIAVTYDYRFLYEEVALAGYESDPVQQFENLLLMGAGADNFNAFGANHNGQPIMIDRQGKTVEVVNDDSDEDEEAR